MMNPNNFRGMLLEEALLYLLQQTGYKVVTTVGNDYTLSNGPAGLVIHGRGADHQIDSIADYILNPPFSYPQRLLVEAKCWNKNIGLDVVRNAVGVRNDLTQYWVARNAILLKSRHHYQYAIFSAEGYSREAIRYAYAHDIYLISIGKSHYFKPIIDAIKNIDTETIQRLPGTLSGWRSKVRARLLSGLPFNGDEEIIPQFINACSTVGLGILVSIGQGFPIFLVPESIDILGRLQFRERVRISYERADAGASQSWFIRSAEPGRFQFSFDMPTELFRFYDENGILLPLQALDLKQELLSTLNLVIVQRGEIKVSQLILDQDWIDRIRSEIMEQRL